MYKYVDRDIAKFKINLAELEDWRDNEKDGLPIRGFVSFYKATGITDAVVSAIANEGVDIVPYDNIVCNFFTLQAIKNFIKNQWKIYSIDIDQDNHVFWKDDQFKKEKHYAKNISQKVNASLITDFANYCPGTDEDLEDYEIVIRLFDKVETEDEES